MKKFIGKIAKWGLPLLFLTMGLDLLGVFKISGIFSTIVGVVFLLAFAVSIGLLRKL